MNKVLASSAFALVLLTGCTQSDPSATPTFTTVTSIPTGAPTMGNFEPSATVIAVSEKVIEKTEAEAIQTIEGVSSEQLSVRITRRDGENYAMTMDYRIDRINLEIDNGIVTKSSIG